MNSEDQTSESLAAYGFPNITIDDISGALTPLRDALEDVHCHVTADAPKLNKAIGNEKTRSQYREDIDNAESEVGPLGKWNGDVVNDVVIYTGMSLTGASYVASSLGRMLYVPISSRAVESLSRTIIETCAKAWWILDPDISTRARVQRALSDELNNAQQLLFAMKKTNNDTLMTYARQRLHVTVKFVQDLGIVHRSDKRGQVMIEGITRPTMSKLIYNFLSSLGFTTGAPAMYGWLSSAAHGDTLHRVSIGSGLPEPPIVTLADIIPTLRIVVMALRALHLRFADYVGSSSTARTRPYDRLIAALESCQESKLPIGRY